MTRPETPTKLFPRIVTDDLDGARRFYGERLGWKQTFDSDEYVSFQCDTGPELAFVRPEPTQEHRCRGFAGAGVVLGVPTPDADELHRRLRAFPDVRILDEPRDQPWNWRSFHVVDPTGVVLDFFHVLDEKPMEDASS